MVVVLSLTVKAYVELHQERDLILVVGPHRAIGPRGGAPHSAIEQLEQLLEAALDNHVRLSSIALRPLVASMVLVGGAPPSTWIAVPLNDQLLVIFPAAEVSAT